MLLTHLPLSQGPYSEDEMSGFQGALNPLLDQRRTCVCPYSHLLWDTYIGFQKSVAHPLTVIK